MQLTSDATWVRVANYYDDEDEPSGVFIEIRGSSEGHHGYRTKKGEWVEETPAGDPFQHTSWEFVTDNYPKLGSEFSVWMGEEGGSYHERWNEMYVTVGKIPPGVTSGGYGRKKVPPKLIGSSIFSDIEDCCEKIVELTGCQPPDSEELSRAIPPKQSTTPVVKPDQANPRHYGETLEQYWTRIRQEKLGQYPYKHEGD